MYNILLRITRKTCYYGPSKKGGQYGAQIQSDVNQRRTAGIAGYLNQGKRAARTVLHARALLLLDAGEHGSEWFVEKVAEAVGMTTRSLEHPKNDLSKKVFPPLLIVKGD